MFRKNKIKLQYLIGMLVTSIILVTTLTNWYVSNTQFKETLIENRLDQNYQYTQNVIDSTTLVLSDMTKNLSTLARMVGENKFNDTDLDDWLEANSHYFNSLFTTDATGVVQLMSPRVVPNNPHQVQPGTKIKSDLMEQTLTERKPFISTPYYSQTGNLMLLVSEPIFNASGEFQGVVNGTIYLERESSLERLVNRHDYLEETTVFVVDSTGKIIYHPTSSRINEDISDHPLIQEVIQGNGGATQTINRLGEEYSFGYGFIEESGWGVITKTPISVIDEPLRILRQEMIVRSLPVIFISLIIAWAATLYIAKPIAQLSRYSRKAIETKEQVSTKIDIQTPIYEINELNKDIQKYLEVLNKEIQIDGLTNLYNRRTFDYKIQKLVDENRAFSLTLLDIDHFKIVNDSYGHLVGDDVLRFLALTLKDWSGEKGLCFRYGGEEFAVILEAMNTEEAFVFAEQLRERLANTPGPTKKPIYISLGITAYQEINGNPNTIIEQADRALYHSKNDGRNKTTIYQEQFRLSGEKPYKKLS